MEQCRLCPAKLWSNADFASRNHRAIVLCPAKSRRLCSLPRKIMEQCRLSSTKLRRHSFRGQPISSNFNFFTFFLIIFVNHCYFRDLYNPLDHFLRKKYFFCHGTFKKPLDQGLIFRLKTNYSVEYLNLKLTWIAKTHQLYYFVG